MRVLVLSVEFYKMYNQEPVHAKLVFPTLERHNEVSAHDCLEGPLERLYSLMEYQLMTTVATISAKNAMKHLTKGFLPGASNYQSTRAPALARNST